MTSQFKSGILASFVCSCMLATAVGGEPSGKSKLVLDVGDQSPEFSARDQFGMVCESNLRLPMTDTVIWFYKGDFCCQSLQRARHLRALVDSRVSRNVQVVGISGDPVENHWAFQEVCAVNFTILSDETGSIARQFGVPLRSGGKARLRNDKGQVVLDPLTNKSIILNRGVTVEPRVFVVAHDGRIVYARACSEASSDIDDLVEFLEQRD